MSGEPKEERNGDESTTSGGPSRLDEYGGIARLSEIIYETLGIAGNPSINMDSRIIHDLGADSLDVVELRMAIEREYDLEVSDEDEKKLTTVGSIVNYLEEHLP